MILPFDLQWLFGNAHTIVNTQAGAPTYPQLCWESIGRSGAITVPSPSPTRRRTLRLLKILLTGGSFLLILLAAGISQF